MYTDNTYVTIDLDAIGANIDAVAAKAGVPVMGIIKADAYGHGAVQVARLLKDKCRFLWQRPWSFVSTTSATPS